jgi:hypothetical protein
VITLVVSAAFAAETWWVPDQERADQLSAAAREEWPAIEHIVRVGERPTGQPGWVWDGATVSVVAEGADRIADATDAHVAVLLGRTWAIHAETPAWEGFLPAPILVAEIEPPPPLATAEKRHSRLAMGLRLGTRTAVGEPYPLQGVHTGLTIEKGHVWTEIDGYLGAGIPIRGQYTLFGTGNGVHDVIYDRATIGFDLGWKGIDKRYGFGWIGPQARAAEHWLYVDRFPESDYSTERFAMEGGAGFGLDGRHFRADLAAWARITAGLPPSLGVALDGWWVIFNPRRRS